MEMFCSTNNKVNTTRKANIIYDIQCPACKEHYIGKTDQCFLLVLINTEVDVRNQCSNT